MIRVGFGGRLTGLLSEAKKLKGYQYFYLYIYILKKITKKKAFLLIMQLFKGKKKLRFPKQ